MKRSTLAAALSLAFASSAWGQALPNGNYVFTSGPGTGYGNQPFAVSGGSNIAGSPGAFVAGAHLPNCSGFHVHGSFFGIADPGGGGCGHGIIGLFGGASAIPGVSGSLPGTAGGMLALNLFPPGGEGSFGSPIRISLSGFGLFDPNVARQYFGDDSDIAELIWPRSVGVLPVDALERLRYDWVGAPNQAPEQPAKGPGLSAERITEIAREDANIVLFGTPNPTAAQLGKGPGLSAERVAEIAREDTNIFLFGTPYPTPEQFAKGPDQSGFGGLRDGSPTPPPAPAANPPADGPKPQPAKPADAPPPLSILRQIDDTSTAAKPPTPAKPPAAEAPDPEREKAQEKAAQDIADDIRSGDKDRVQRARDAMKLANSSVQFRTLEILGYVSRVDERPIADGLLSGNKEQRDKAALEYQKSSPATRENVRQEINLQMRAIVNNAMRASTNAAAGAPRLN